MLDVLVAKQVATASLCERPRDKINRNAAKFGCNRRLHLHDLTHHSIVLSGTTDDGKIIAQG